MHHHTLEGRKTKEQSQPSEGTLWARDVPVSIRYQGLCPAREAGERCGQPMGNWETGQTMLPVEHELMLHILFLRNANHHTVDTTFPPRKHNNPKSTPWTAAWGCKNPLHPRVSGTVPSDWFVCSSYPYTLVCLILMRADVGP